jgi:Cd(II)/Pb(II)-responsive transcriptional regulator
MMQMITAKRIGELAEAAKCSVETVRFYEKEGLLPKANRGANNYRLYSSRHAQRLRFIRNCRALDMSHEEVRTLLRLMEDSDRNCGSVDAVLDDHIDQVDARIRELEQLKDHLTALRKRCRCQSVVRECRIIEGLSTMQPQRRSAIVHHR